MIIYKGKDLLAVKILLISEAFPPPVGTEIVFGIVLSAGGDNLTGESLLVVRSANVPFCVSASHFSSCVSYSNSSVTDGGLGRAGVIRWYR